MAKNGTYPIDGAKLYERIYSTIYSSINIISTTHAIEQYVMPPFPKQKAASVCLQHVYLYILAVGL